MIKSNETKQVRTRLSRVYSREIIKANRNIIQETPSNNNKKKKKKKRERVTISPAAEQSQNAVGTQQSMRESAIMPTREWTLTGTLEALPRRCVEV